MDSLLRLIYPGIEPPEITDLSALTALLSVAHKYNITSVYPALKGTLKTFLPVSAFGVYVIACRFGFTEVAREAAKVGTTESVSYGGLDKDAQVADLLR